MSAQLKDEVSYRRLQAADLVSVADLERSLYAFPWSLGNFRDSLEAGYDCWVACRGAQVVAYAILMIALEEAHLLNLAVDARCQNQGLGRTFLDFILSIAKQAGCDVVYLEVRPSNQAARHLYRKVGFQQIAVRPGYYPAPGGREDALFLGITL